MAKPKKKDDTKEEVKVPLWQRDEFKAHFDVASPDKLVEVENALDKEFKDEIIPSGKDITLKESATILHLSETKLRERVKDPSFTKLTGAHQEKKGKPWLFNRTELMFYRVMEIRHGDEVTEKKEKFKPCFLFKEYGILNEPKWNPVTNDYWHDKMFTKDYVVNKFKGFFGMVSHLYDVSVKGSYDEIKETTWAQEMNEDPKVWKEDVECRISELEDEFPGVKVVYIFHDKDTILKQAELTEADKKTTDAEGKPLTQSEIEAKQKRAENEMKIVNKALHCHFVILSENPILYWKVYKIMKVSSEMNLEPLKNQVSALSYLVHDTKDAREEGKHRYADSELKFENTTLEEYQYLRRTNGEKINYLKQKVRSGEMGELKAKKIGKNYLTESSWLSLQEKIDFQQQRDAYIAEVVSDYTAQPPRAYMNRVNIYCQALGKSGKTALAYGLARVFTDKHDPDDVADVYVATQNQEGLASDTFGTYNGESFSIFNEFKGMEPRLFNDVFDNNNVNKVSRKQKNAVEFISRYNYFNSDLRIQDVLAKSIIQSNHNLWRKGINSEYDFDRLKDVEPARSLFDQMARRMKFFLKIQNETVYIYRYIKVIDDLGENEKTVLRKLANGLINYEQVGVVKGYKLSDDDIKANMAIADRVATDIKAILKGLNFNIREIRASRDKDEFDDFMAETSDPFGSVVADNVLHFYEDFGSRLVAYVIPLNLYYWLYKGYVRRFAGDSRILNYRDFQDALKGLTSTYPNLQLVERCKIKRSVRFAFDPIYNELLARSDLDKYVPWQINQDTADKALMWEKKGRNELFKIPLDYKKCVVNLDSLDNVDADGERFISITIAKNIRTKLLNKKD